MPREHPSPPRGRPVAAAGHVHAGTARTAPTADRRRPSVRRPPGRRGRHRAPGASRRTVVLGTLSACALGLFVAVLISGLVPGTEAAGRLLVADPAPQAALVERDRQAAAEERPPSRGKTRAAAPGGAKSRKRPDPVAGLSQRQMDHAAVIVAAARDRQLPERAMLVGLMTAMQETNLRNLANPGVPSSLTHRNDGTGTDHDSVGIFQQRPSQGWGSVAELMDPSYASDQFFRKLARTPGWETMSLTRAAQAVQRSAFPDAYAKHEAKARAIVEALT
ncbi:MAG TPA: hypothetical protein VFY17_11935 [Pilimelia sp.]|nr:hypothetical protein [Pilimelia sp.]